MALTTPTFREAGMADRTTSTHPPDLPIDAAKALAELGLSEAGASPDPAVAAYHRLRAAVADDGDVAAAEDALIATRAATPAGVGAKLVELAGHEGWFANPHYYQTRLIHSALADLKGLEGRT